MSEHGVPDSRIRVIKQVEDYITYTGSHYAQWLCECLCEEHNQLVVMEQDLCSRHTKSCGCYGREKLIAASKKYNRYEKRYCDSLQVINNENKLGIIINGRELFVYKDRI